MNVISSLDTMCEKIEAQNKEGERNDVIYVPIHCRCHCITLVLIYNTKYENGTRLTVQVPTIFRVF